MGFSKDFVWGCATASYQVEGGYLDDGKGLNVWDICSHVPGFVRDGNNGDVTCDQYHKFKEDVKLMKEIGLKSYRFSVNWARVLPTGDVKDGINEAGLQYYSDLVDELLANGIEPYLTVFHWDYPNELFKRGGWLNPESPKWFENYTKVLVDRLSDRVTHWMTLNEPQCFVNLGHDTGVHAPGLKLPMVYLMEIYRNVLLAHGHACMTIRKYTKKPCEIGFAPVAGVDIPYTDSKEDIEAAKFSMFAIDSHDMLWKNSIWMDPIVLGKFPEGAKEYAGECWPNFTDEDLKIIHQPLDFFGMNSYQGNTVKHREDGKPGFEVLKREDGYDHTAIRWPITPKILYWGPVLFYERYKLPILVTENGMSNYDLVSEDGCVHDPQRIEFLKRYLREFKKASDVVPLKGYTQWSFMDNFEWAEGYNERFGIVYTDYVTGKRILKDSAKFYAEVIKTNGENL